MTTLTLTDCLREIASRKIPWAGEPGAGFDTGLYAVLDHAYQHASAVLYYRPEEHEFLLYIYSASADGCEAAKVADAVTNYLKRAGVIEGAEIPGDVPAGALLHELDKTEAQQRLAAIKRALQPDYREVWPYSFH